MHSIKKRKLQLNRETVMPIQSHRLRGVVGGEDNVLGRAAESGGASAIASAVVTAAAGETASACVAVSGATSAVAASVDHVSNRLNLPCWAATSLGSAAIHFTRKW